MKRYRWIRHLESSFSGDDVRTAVIELDGKTIELDIQGNEVVMKKAKWKHVPHTMKSFDVLVNGTIIYHVDVKDRF